MATPTHITRTLVGIDFSPGSLAALDFAQRLARRDTEPVIHAVHAFAWPMVPLATADVALAIDFDRRARLEIERSLREVVDKHRDPRIPIETLVLDGSASAVVDHASRLSCARLVIGATGRGVLPRVLARSTAERLVRTSSVDVLVVPPTAGDLGATALRRIVCATDFSAASEVAILHAIELARAHDATLDLVHAWDAPSYLQRIAGLAGSIERELRHQLDDTLLRHRTSELKLTTELRLGRAADCAIGFALERGADLLVLGTCGKGGIDRWLLGSVAERVVRASALPVLVAHPRASRSAGPMN